MTVSEGVTLALLFGIFVGVWYGRKRGRQRLAATVSAARAEGHAEARAELAATLTNTVQVVAGHPLPGEQPRDSDALVAALRRFSVETLGVPSTALPPPTDSGWLHDLGASPNGSASDDHDDDDDDDSVHAVSIRDVREDGLGTFDRVGSSRRVDRSARSGVRSEMTP